jgi:hypothetical protein
MRTYVDPAIHSVRRIAQQLQSLATGVSVEELEADEMPQGANKAARHQALQRQLGEDLCQKASELNKIGARLKATA